MTFIPANFDDVQETKPVPAGRYHTMITGCVVAPTGPNSKVPGSPQFRVTIGLPGNSSAPNITQFISLPNGQEEQKSADYKVLLLKRFLELYKVRYDRNGIDTERLAMDMVGCEAMAEIALSEPDDNGNVYNRLVVPRIVEERR